MKKQRVAIQTDNGRVLYIDVVKAFAIFTVCAAHSSLLLEMDKPSVVVTWISSFHMQLFMLLSGFFSTHALQQPCRIFVTRKALQLLVPAFTIPFLKVLLCAMFDGQISLDMMRSEIVGGLWFLKVLFLCYLYVWLFKRLPLDDGCLCLLSVVVACLLPHGYFLQFNFMVIFFWTGYFLHKYRERIERFRLPLMILSVLFFLFFGRHLYPELLTYSVLFEHPNVVVWQYFTALSASMSVYWGGYYLVKAINCQIWQMVARIGANTLGIYAIQTILLEVLLKHYVHIGVVSVPEWIIELVVIPLLGIITTWLTYLIVMWLRRYGWARMLFLGMPYNATKIN